MRTLPVSSPAVLVRRLAVPLATGALLASTGALVAADATTAPTTSMAAPRAQHAATALPDGSVVVSGGRDASGNFNLRPTEVYRPTSRTWERVGSLGLGRNAAGTAALSDGRVLVTGGQVEDDMYGVTDSVEVYDDTTGTWSETTPLQRIRYEHTATTLSDGRVLVTGGTGFAEDSWTTLAGSEVFDPVTEQWTVAGSLSGARTWHTATLLDDGTVLVVGGSDGVEGSPLLRRTETFDPATGTWTAAGPLATGRAGHTATLMGDGKVLVTGGFNAAGSALATSEVFDPLTRTWSKAASLSAPRSWHAATELADGRVLVAGGRQNRTTAVYSPVSKTWRSAGDLGALRKYPSVTALPDGTALVAGGEGLRTAEIVTPPIEEHARTLTLGAAHETVSGKRRLVLSGALSVADGTTSCRVQRPVTLARLNGSTGKWVTLATPVTADDGSYRAVVADSTGRYRARVAADSTTVGGTTSTCGAAEALRRHTH